MGAGKQPLILKLGHDIYIWSCRIFDIVLVFVSRDFELGRNVSCDSRIYFFPILMKFNKYVEYCTIAYSMTRSKVKVKVKSPWKL